MNEKIHLTYWKESDYLTLEDISAFKQLGELGLAIIGRTPGGMHMVSGPISTGGVGSVEGNLKVFSYVVDHLASKSNLPVFSQIPFEEKMAELAEIWFQQNESKKYCTPILEDFYERIFSSGKVVKLHFIHGWESSFGAKWEHANCDRWKIARSYLSESLSLEAVSTLA